jgi:hypothetical protein
MFLWLSRHELMAMICLENNRLRSRRLLQKQGL